MAQKQKHAKKEEKEAKVEFDFGFGGLLGGLFKGIEHLVDLAEKAEKAGGELKKEGGWRGGTKERPARAVYGFTIRTGLGKAGSRIQTFGNIKKTKQGPRVMETREPLVDVFDEEDEIRVIAELPGVQEADIELDLRGDMLNLETRGERKYAKEIFLQAKVDAASKAVSFKNGILEVKFKKI
jgi:HSP20 family protein